MSVRHLPVTILPKLRDLARAGRAALADIGARTSTVTLNNGWLTAVVTPNPPAAPAPVPCTQAAPGSRLCILCARRHA